MAISLSEFVKFYPLKASGLTWLFGAGSSVSAGVPSAYDLNWDFKRRIYCAEQAYPLHLFSNLTDFGIREQIQNYFDTQRNCPPFDSSEEYSYYFERAFSSARDRIYRLKITIISTTTIYQCFYPNYSPAAFHLITNLTGK